MSDALLTPATTELLPEEASWLGFDTTVPRALVHKRAISEVLVSDSRALDNETLLCAAQLPAMHRLHGPRAGHHELLAIAEATRQAVELVAHRYLDVPPSRSFIFRSIDLRTIDRDALRSGGVSAELILCARLRDRRTVAGSLASFGLAGTVHIDGHPAVLGSGSCIFLKAEDYLALRTGAVPSQRGVEPSPRRAEPALVGRQSEDVVISPPQQAAGHSEAELIVDLSHPSFFDHPQDHVPGALLLEGMRQLALARAAGLSGEPADSWILTRCAASFERFAEFRNPVVLSAAGERTPEGFTLALHARQDGPVATGEIVRGEVALAHV